MTQSIRIRRELHAVNHRPEPKTLLTGMPYHSAATHGDPRAFFTRMIEKYGLKLKERKNRIYE